MVVPLESDKAQKKAANRHCLQPNYLVYSQCHDATFEQLKAPGFASLHFYRFAKKHIIFTIKDISDALFCILVYSRIVVNVLHTQNGRSGLQKHRREDT